MKPFQTKDKATGELRYGGAWLIKYKAPDGKYRKQVGGATAKEAEKTLRGILVDIERGRWVDPRQEKREVEECKYKTFGDICDAFSRAYASRSAAARRNLKETLVVFHKGVRKTAPLLPATTLIAELTPARLRRVRDALDAMPGTPATKNLRLTYLKMILRWAWKHPSIPVSDNLGEGLERFRERGTRGGSGMLQGVGRDEVFSRADAAQMVDYAFANSDLVTAHMLQTAFLTGLRKGELAGMKWCDVDFERRLVLVCRSYSRRGTKSGKDRSVPMPLELVKSLRDWKAASPSSKETDPVFPNADGKHREESFSWSQMVHRIAVGAEVDRPGMKRWGHLTRHTFATQWLLAGGSDAILARILGHRDTNLIHAVYSHFCDLDFVNAVDRIDLSLATKPATILGLPGVVSSKTTSTPEHAIG
jgi:integrase